MSDYQNPVSRRATLHRFSYPTSKDCAVLGVLQTTGQQGNPINTPISEGQGLKYDDKKEPLALLSRTWLLGVAAVMGFGAKKYAEHNWRSGHKRSRLISAALRHILAYNEGEDLDPESGLNHLDHASCCLQFAREGHETHPGMDDRWRKK